MNGRAHDTLGPIETFEMGEAEEGMRALEAKARAIHADLILAVKFEHGEGS